MLKRYTVILAAVLIAVIGISLYFTYRVPPGVEAKGDGSETVAWVSLATGVVSLLTALVGLVQKWLDLRAAPRRD